jgi:hypothetical protein
MLWTLLNIESSPSSKPCNDLGKSSGCSAFPPFFDLTPHSLSCHFGERVEADRFNSITPPCLKPLGIPVSRDDLEARVKGAERGQRRSTFRKPASIVVCCGFAVDKHLREPLPARNRTWGPCGAAWSNMKPYRGLGLKKQMPSDCNLRNLRRFDDGTGFCKADRIAAEKAITIGN